MTEIPSRPELFREENRQIFKRIFDCVFSDEDGEVYQPDPWEDGITFFGEHQITGQSLQIAFTPITEATIKKHPDKIFFGLDLPVIEVILEPKGKDYGLYTTKYGVLPGNFIDAAGNEYFVFNRFCFDSQGFAVKVESISRNTDPFAVDDADPLPHIDIDLSNITGDQDEL